MIQKRKSNNFRSRCKKLKLNLGCGSDYRKGYTNIDRSPHTKCDLVLDLDKYPFPFETGSVDFIVCNAVMENLTDVVKFMDEIHRILKRNGKMRFRCAMAFTYVDAKDPTHKQHFIPSSFNLWVKGFSSQNLTKIRFKGKVWITIPFFHKIRFPKHLFVMNSFINNIFTGIEGEFIKE